MEQQTMPVSPFADEQPIVEETTTTPGSPFEEEVLDEESEGEISDEVEETEDDEEYEEDSEELEDDEELIDEELEELLKELEAAEEDTDEEAVDVVPHAALHKERERRKEVQRQMQEIQQQAQQVVLVAEEYKQALENIKAQLKENGLDDLIEIEEPAAASPEVVEARMQKQRQQEAEQLANLVTQMREEAISHVDEFPAIDPNDSDTGELILGYTLANVLLGEDMEAALLKAMGIVNSKILAERKAVQRKTVTKPVRKTSRKRAAPPQRRRQLENGDISGFFKSVASDMLQK